LFIIGILNYLIFFINLIIFTVG